MDLSIVITVVAIVAAVAVLVWVYSHPLNAQQLAELAARRRLASVRAYFRFHGAPVTADSAFKQKMPPRGGWFNFDCQMEIWPATAAALFKYKKHEWVVVAFLHDRRVSRLWINKGAESPCRLIPSCCSRNADGEVFPPFFSTTIIQIPPFASCTCCYRAAKICASRSNTRPCLSPPG